MKKKTLKSKCKVEAEDYSLVDKIKIMIKDLNQHLNKAENEIEKDLKDLEEKTGIVITSIELNEDEDDWEDDSDDDSKEEKSPYLITLKHNLFNDIE